MPARTVRSTMVFNQTPLADYGWEESWDRSYDESVALIDILRGDTTTLATKRIAICGNETSIVSIKVAVLDQPRLYQTYTWPSGGLVNDAHRSGPDVESWHSDDPDTALLLQLEDLSGANHSHKFLRGIPDAIVSQGGQYSPSLAPGFETAMNAFKTFLKSRYGWEGANRAGIRSSDITDVTLPMDGHPIITTRENMFAGELTKRLKVTISGVTGAASVNGQRVVTVTGNNTCQMLRRTPMFPYTGPSGKLTALRTTFAVIGFTEITRVVDRKAGAPLPRIRGRARVRKLA